MQTLLAYPVISKYHILHHYTYRVRKMYIGSGCLTSHSPLPVREFRLGGRCLPPLSRFEVTLLLRRMWVAIKDLVCVCPRHSEHSVWLRHLRDDVSVYIYSVGFLLLSHSSAPDMNQTPTCMFCPLCSTNRICTASSPKREHFSQ